MADGIKGTMQLTGFKELNDIFKQIPEAVGGPILKKGLKDAAAPMIEEAKALAPVKTGWLRDSIMGKSANTDDKRTAVVILGIAKAPATYVTTGARRGKRVIDPSIYAKWVEYGYHLKSGAFEPARSFMRAAFSSKKDAVIEVLRYGIKQRLEKFNKAI